MSFFFPFNTLDLSDAGCVGFKKLITFIKRNTMKIQSLIIAGMMSLIGCMTISTAFADTSPSATALCKDGTSYSGTSKKGACSGHKGIKEWYGSKTADAAPAPADKAAAAPEKAAAPAPAAAPSKPMASSAKAPAAGGGDGKVWVNTDSKVYHCQGSRYYGKTKQGSYMTESEAKAQGNRPDHGKACS